MSLPYTDKNNDPIREKFVTFGIGLPFSAAPGKFWVPAVSMWHWKSAQEESCRTAYSKKASLG